MFIDELDESLVGLCPISGIEYISNVIGDDFSLVKLGHVSLGVLLQMELAALPGGCIQSGFERGFKPFVSI